MQFQAHRQVASMVKGLPCNLYPDSPLADFLPHIPPFFKNQHPRPPFGKSQWPPFSLYLLDCLLLRTLLSSPSFPNNSVLGLGPLRGFVCFLSVRAHPLSLTKTIISLGMRLKLCLQPPSLPLVSEAHIQMPVSHMPLCDVPFNGSQILEIHLSQTRHRLPALPLTVLLLLCDPPQVMALPSFTLTTPINS